MRYETDEHGWLNVNSIMSMIKLKLTELKIVAVNVCCKSFDTRSYVSK